MARLPRFPDLLTTANLACGAGSILLASYGQLTVACWLVFAGALFDVFDGLAARALGGGSPLGAQLDSLADMVTFGVAPAFCCWMAYSTEAFSAGHTSTSGYHLNGPHAAWVAVAAILLCIASAWRLAKFNVDDRQSSGFLGLPTPANGLFWVSAILVTADVGTTDLAEHSGLRFLFIIGFTQAPWAVAVLALVLSGLMLSELPLPSLKFKHFRWQGNQVIYLLGGIGLMLVVLYGILAVPLIMGLYILSPFWGRSFQQGN
jgi:CDP-diacylglycerol--serine O-phosphatidyltransferase